jgi:uncharacterized protein
MPADTARRANDAGFAQAGGTILQLAFCGGEPTLALERMEEATGYAKAQAAHRGTRLYLSVTTNATLLDERRLRLLEAHAFQVQVSLDGCPAAQDACRRHADGRPSSEKVEANLRALIARGFQPRVVSVIDPANVRWLGESFDYLLTQGARSLYFVPNYRGDWTPEACDSFEAALADLGQRYLRRFRGGEDVRLDPINGKIVTHLLVGTRKPETCAFGQNELAVSPSGRLYPCDRVVAEDDGAAMCLGDLDAGIDVARRDAILAARREIDTECAACELRLRCTHWCGCVNFESSGHPARVTPLICWFERCWIAEADRVANALFSERNPAFLRRFYARSAQPG